MVPRPPECFHCAHYLRTEGGGDTPIMNFCRAFPDGDGIPLEVLLMEPPHHEVRPDQVGDFVFLNDPSLEVRDDPDRAPSKARRS